MCNKTDAQIGKIIREALSEIVELEAEETRNKLLGLPRYEYRYIGHSGPEVYGFSYEWAITLAGDGIPIALFLDEEGCKTVVGLLNKAYERSMSHV